MRDPFGPVPTARQSITNTIVTYAKRIAGYDRFAIEEAEDELARVRGLLAEDEKHLAEWQEIDAGAFPRVSGDITVLGPGIFAAADCSVLCWRGQNYVPQS